MNIHQEILAKSEQNGHVCLYQHLKPYFRNTII